MTNLKICCVLQQSIDALHNTKNALMFICGGEMTPMVRQAVDDAINAILENRKAMTALQEKNK